ncbi:WD40 repeat domain-containing protein [Endozoicomonas ascidiicola]|uniref:WD40 repeat domain-containing protein n=1 Tax=Endozoicomonas ascidiicola TaxID=1698521 RepID=UPI000A9A4A1D|nr:WD40 repeat domain-containing protein [Endozoicomonas ascidiicola]
MAQGEFYRNKFPKNSKNVLLPAIISSEVQKIMHGNIKLNILRKFKHPGDLLHSCFMENCHLLATVSTTEKYSRYSRGTPYNLEVRIYNPHLGAETESGSMVASHSHTAIRNIISIQKNSTIFTIEDSEHLLHIRKILPSGKTSLLTSIPFTGTITNLAASKSGKHIGFVSQIGQGTEAKIYTKSSNGTISETHTISSEDGPRIEKIIFNNGDTFAIIQGWKFHTILSFTNGIWLNSPPALLKPHYYRSNFSISGNTVVTACKEKSITVKDLHPPCNSSTITLVHPDNKGAFCKGWVNKDGTFLITSDSSKDISRIFESITALWKLTPERTYQRKSEVIESRGATICSFSDDECFAAAGTDNAKVHIFSLNEDKKPVQFQFTPKHDDLTNIKSLTFNSRSSHLLAASCKGEIKVFEHSPKKKQWLEKLTYQHPRGIESLEFSPDERFLCLTDNETCTILEIVPE